MKTVIIIYVCVALLPSIIHGNDGVKNWKKSLCEELEKMSRINQTINGIFQPSQGGFLRNIVYAITFKGTLLEPIKREVAMKFTPKYFGQKAENEYEAYSDLGAINNTNVEQYGIPTVYYYGRWKDYVLMAITLLDSEYTRRLSNQTLNDADILIVAREFVRISKYIHYCGVHHSYIRLDNLMFLKEKAFIIDFNLATRLHRKDLECTFGIRRRNVYEDRRRYAKEDWGCFLHSVCVYIGVQFKEFNHCATCRLIDRIWNISKSNLRDDIKKIDNLKNESFKRIFVEMAKNVFKGEIDLWAAKGERKVADEDTTHVFPLYDDLYRIINEEINKLDLPKPIFVSWLTDEERKKAKKELEKKQLPDISTIKDRFEYPEVNFNYFA